MSKNKIRKITGSYEKWLIKSLKNRTVAKAYLKIALEEYQKDKDEKALDLALTHVIKAQNKKFI